MFKDLFIEGCPEFNSFLYDYKSGFELANYDGLKQKFNQKIADCGEKEAVVMFQALKERDPYDESLYAALMNYYNARGRYRKSACAYKAVSYTHLVGAATVFSALVDREYKVRVVIDEEVAREEWYGCSDGTTTGYMKVKTSLITHDLLNYARHIPAIIKI